MLNSIGTRITQIAASKGVLVQYQWAGQTYPKLKECDGKPNFVEFYFQTLANTMVRDVRSIEEDLALGLKVRDLRVRAERGNLAVQISLKKPDSLLYSTAMQLREWKPFEFLAGVKHDSTPLVGDLQKAEFAHTLITGITGCGKSNLARCIALSLCETTKPRDIGFMLLDAGKSNEGFAGQISRHLISRATTVEEATRSMRKLLGTFRTRTLKDPRVIVYCDELPELCRQGGNEIVEALSTIANIGRGVGVHFLFCAQYPKSSEVPGAIKSNATLRVVGRTNSAAISTLCTGIPQMGCERLGPSGDFIAIVRSDDHRVQAPLTPEPPEPEEAETLHVEKETVAAPLGSATAAAPVQVSLDDIIDPSTDDRVAVLAAQIEVVLRAANGHPISNNEICRRATGSTVRGTSFKARFDTALAVAQARVAQ